MQLTTSNLNNHGWMFSATLKIMVREHECGGGRWDVEADSYINQNTSADPRWENDQKFFDSAKTLAALLIANPDFTTTRDWVDGNTVNFF